MRKFNFHSCGNFKESYKQELAVFETDSGKFLLIIALIFIFGFIPFAGNSWIIRTLNMIGIYSIAAIGLNILTGYTGMISLGHSAIFGIGAYATAFLATRINIPIWVAIPASGIISVIIGIGFSLPAARLMGFYLCFATLAAQKIMEYCFIHCTALTNGPSGISMTGPHGLPVILKNDVTLFYLIFIILALMTWMAVNLIRSKFGRGFIAIRDKENVAEIMGVPALKYKQLSFAISAFYTGIAGSLFALYNINVSPELFNLSFSIILIAMIIIGGTGSLSGSIIGAIILVMLKEGLIYSDKLLAGHPALWDGSIKVSSLYELIAGILIAVFILFKPKGMADIGLDIRTFFGSWPFSKGIHYGSKR
jgi:branched-chain amino acid transport system permease protein